MQPVKIKNPEKAAPPTTYQRDTLTEEKTERCSQSLL